MAKVGYFPGCTLHASAHELDDSTRALASRLGIELEEIPDWTCCGATAAHSMNHLLGLSLPARNLSLAATAHMEAVMAPCAACFNRLAVARHELLEDAALRKQVEGIIERPLDTIPEVHSVLSWLLAEVGKGTDWAKVDLSQMKVACYYGCLLLRPPAAIAFDDVEQPTSMERIVQSVGVEPVDWHCRLRCCGAGFSVSRTGIVLRLVREILSDAKRSGADAVVLGCPMCHSNLDLRQQAAIERQSAIPILFLPQLLGLAAGCDPKELGLFDHMVDTQDLLRKVPAGKV